MTLYFEVNGKRERVKKDKPRPFYFVGDFETTVEDDTDLQNDTRVWSSALLGLNCKACEWTRNPLKDKVRVDTSIADAYKFLNNLRRDCVVYYHNLRFDGSFWLNYLVSLGYRTSLDMTLNEMNNKKNMKRKDLVYTISNLGQWYSIKFKTPRGNFIEFRDSLKLLPFNLKRLGKAFGTKHQKKEMEYKGDHFDEYGNIKKEFLEYIENDVWVLKEGLEIMFQEGHSRLTIGSCCMDEFVRSLGGEKNYDNLFPDLTEIEVPKEIKSDAQNVDEYLRKAYHGGWCYAVPWARNTKVYNGYTYDVNSLYPSMMSSESGNYYPIGEPRFFKGKPPKSLKAPADFWYVRVKCRFKLKDGYLPMIQIKDKPKIYRPNEWLETSDVYDREDDTYKRYWIDSNGEKQDTINELTFTMFEWEKVKEHYDLFDLEYLDGVAFKAEIGLFDSYIEKYREMKMNSTGARRELAKLFLNNLYGKMASSTASDFKVAHIEDEILKFETIKANNKEAGFLAVGAAITSYSRCFTISAAQSTYHGKGKQGFKYADTDSIHGDFSQEDRNKIPVHDNAFCHWKCEGHFSVAWFCRQKTYIEMMDDEMVIRACGMSQKSKNLFMLGMLEKEERQKHYKSLDSESIKWLESLENPLSIEDFKQGLCIWGKLMPRQVKGGILLRETYFNLR